MEDVRQTLQVHASQLQSIQRALNISGAGPAQLPEGVCFPLKTIEDVDNLEVMLADDASMRSAIVSEQVTCCQVKTDLNSLTLQAEI